MLQRYRFELILIPLVLCALFTLRLIFRYPLFSGPRVCDASCTIRLTNHSFSPDSVARPYFAPRQARRRSETRATG